MQEVETPDQLLAALERIINGSLPTSLPPGEVR